MNKEQAIEAFSHTSMGDFERFILNKILFNPFKGVDEGLSYSLRMPERMHEKIAKREEGEAVITVTNDICFGLQIKGLGGSAYGVVRYVSPLVVFKRKQEVEGMMVFSLDSITDSEAVDVCVHQGSLPDKLDTVEYSRFIEVLTPDYRTRAPKRIVALAARLRSLYQHSTNR